MGNCPRFVFGAAGEEDEAQAEEKGVGGFRDGGNLQTLVDKHSLGAGGDIGY